MEGNWATRIIKPATTTKCRKNFPSSTSAALKKKAKTQNTTNKPRREREQKNKNLLLLERFNIHVMSSRLEKVPAEMIFEIVRKPKP